MYPVGRWYLPTNHPTANEQHQATWSILREFNALSNTDPARSRELLRHLFPRSEFLPEAWAPLHLELGVNTRFGEGCFINFNCTILDVAPVDIGARTLFGPGCQLITVGHPVDDHAARAEGWEIAHPIAIGDDCWFGAGAMVMPGVTVGDRCVVAAGAVVTRDLPAGSLAAGVPASVKRQL
ncbi:sugar O-acetyltransferase [Corynebacterium timonense]|uniref:Maltose O-acetyltransferase n=1 Tax=Corynebacterium timonense TaxID=441500 RepID=A0A1H1TVV0_9CORY|nr:sugar O-acetyltransferase [Corynebacterium timonense]SDS64312.1 maltose O-acetyltransferase [Corynebacterium timonense]